MSARVLWRAILLLIILNFQFSILNVNGQTLNVQMGQVTYQFPATQAGDMLFSDGSQLTIMGRTFSLSDITGMYIDDSAATDTLVSVVYSDATAAVTIPGCAAKYVDASVDGAHVSIAQSDSVSDDNIGEITYALSGESGDGEFYLSGSYKSTVELRGLTLTNTNPEFSGAAIHVQNGKRINISAKRGTINTLTDAANGTQKGCIYVKGHAELKGQGTLNINGRTAHGVKSGDYMTLRNCTLNILSAVKDGISCNEYYLQQSGAVTISGTGDDAVQADLDGTTSTGVTTDHEDEDTGNIYLTGGTLTATVTADACKGLNTAGDVVISGGELNITQTGSIVTTDDDISYPTSIKADGNVSITGGTVTINNTAAGGKGISADGSITIDESNATTVINVTANGTGGVAELSGGDDDTPTASYKVYVSLPTSGGGGNPFGGGGSNTWKTVYLYKGDGTLVQQLTNTVSKSSGYSSTTFYYYDFKAADSGTYYFKSDNYTSRGTTYTIVSATFTGPTDGNDIYYTITNSYTTSGSTRTYKLTNVTNTYSGSSDTSEEEGTGYNAIGIKADGDITIGGGTITVKNSGEMSKSIKSKGTVNINGGNITLTPSGAMKVISGDAGYSSGIKTVDFVQNDGTLTINASGAAGRGISGNNITTNGGTLKITNSGAGQTGSSDTYTAKGIKADGYMKLNDGTITISMTGSGGKGIKVNGTYTQGSSDGNGPTLTVSTTGSAVSSDSSSGGGGNPFGGGGGMGENLSGTAKAIKVQGTVTLYGGTTEISTKTDGAEGLESKTAVYIEGGKHYLACYDDCINSSGNIYFNGGATVCYSNGNDAVDSNAGRTGAITIGNGAVLAYTTKGSPEEGLDCDNNSYIQITGTGIAISGGAAQGGGMGGGSSSTISNAKQGYYFSTSSLSYQTGQYYTIANSSGTNLVTYSFPASFSSTLSLFTATGMVKGSSYTIKSSSTAPTDATTAWHGLYIGSSAVGTTPLTSFTAQ